MRHAAREMGQRDGRELRRAQRPRRTLNRLAAPLRQPRGRPAPAACAPGGRPGRSTASARRRAEHGGAPVIGADRPARERRDDVEPSPIPAETNATARLRCRVNQRVGRCRQRRVEAAGGDPDQPENDAGTARASRPGSPRSARRRAGRRRRHDQPRCRSGRDKRAPSSKASPMHRKAIVAALEMPVRDQPVSSRHRLQEHAKRHRRAEPDAGDHNAGSDDDPAVIELHALVLGWRRIDLSPVAQTGHLNY